MEVSNIASEKITKMMATDSDLIVVLILYLMDDNKKIQHRIKQVEALLNQNSNNINKSHSNEVLISPKIGACAIKVATPAVDKRDIKALYGNEIDITYQGVQDTLICVG